MYGEEIAERQYSEKKCTQREPEYDEDTDRYRRKFTQVKWGGRDARREPDSGLGYTQDWHSQRWTTDRDGGTEGRQMDDRIPEITGIDRSSQWDFHVRRNIQWIIRKRYIGGSRRLASRGTEWNRSKDK